MGEKKLTLSTTDKKLAGVCGGLAEYFGLDSNLIRIILVCCVIFGGFGILLYLIAWLVMSMSN
jgi:phage shock protein PspC (stress-responsive transcriptional regulator)